MSTGPFEPGETIPKDPDAELPYDWDWSEWLGDDAEIASITVTAETGLDVDDSDIVTPANQVVRVWLSGGDAGESYKVTCRVTTDETPPRIDDRSVRIRVRER